MKKYEGMFIFPDAFSDEQLDSAVTRVRGEIEKIGGTIESAIRMGRRNFARELQKTQAGQYVVITFELEPEQIDPLKGNLRFNDEIFRMQIFLAPEKPDVVPAAVAAADVEEND